ncbi:glycosyl transferase family 2 [Geobacter metallireducens RCH3]|uniref:Glycosyltransferase n=1 Tax=Geobacter metallireducens (strain ATCC 53774 / DSM 7210 / GS-15) TaxID=269799 RepID=Q39RM2_GEOMG|nr:glycosyltransferase family 2 protein [Geobacter metallireducens]ABB33102.1 glycosyltransferase [Geobacter metallireducens GS-15]EHP87101.1 glycosyl transferase family 2 [Geobacter metallireducens RCH3]
MKLSATIAIILLNWNGWRDTVDCVESCRKLDYPNFRIVIVDNGSTDGSEAILRERFPDVELIQTGANLGFAGGNNAGIRHALVRGADYVWLLNNDTVVEPGALGALVRVAESDPRVGMVGSKIVYFDDPWLLWFAGAVIDPERPHRPFHRGLHERDTGQYDRVAETGYVTGCSLLARREMMAEVGMLDDDLFLYFEDADWSARAARAGWKLLYVPDSVVRHKESVSSGGAASPRLVYYTARNRLYFVRRNFPAKLAAALCYDLFEHVLVNVKKGRFPLAVAGCRGIRDFLAGKIGPMP